MQKKFKKYLLVYCAMRCANTGSAALIHGYARPVYWPEEIMLVFRAINDEYACRRVQNELRRERSGNKRPKLVRLYVLTDVTKQTKKETA